MRFVPSFNSDFVCDSVSHLQVLAAGDGISLLFLDNLSDW